MDVIEELDRKVNDLCESFREKSEEDGEIIVRGVIFGLITYLVNNGLTVNIVGQNPVKPNMRVNYRRDVCKACHSIIGDPQVIIDNYNKKKKSKLSKILKRKFTNP